MSREKLAAKIGTISSSTIKRAEEGADNVSEDAIETIARALGLDYDQKHKLLRTRDSSPDEAIPDRLERIARELMVIGSRLRNER